MAFFCMAKPIPMKRELKRQNRYRAVFIRCKIAKPIPMKRELKLQGAA